MADFIEENLAQGEKIAYRTSLHWMMLLGETLTVAISLPFLLKAFLLWKNPSSDQMEADLGLIACVFIGGVLFLIGFFMGVSDLWRLKTTHYAVTNKRLVLKLGLIDRRLVDTPLGKIESLTVKQGILGRIFNYGTLVLTYTGGSFENLENVRAPLELKKQIESRFN